MDKILSNLLWFEVRVPSDQKGLSAAELGASPDIERRIVECHRAESDAEFLVPGAAFSRQRSCPMAAEQAGEIATARDRFLSQWALCRVRG